MNAVKKTIAILAVASTALVPMASPGFASDRGMNSEGDPPGGNWQNGHRPYIHNRHVNNRHFVRKHHGKRRHHGRKLRGGISGGDAAGIAILGVIGGALIGQALSNQNQPRYVQPQPQYRAPRHDTDLYPPAPRRVKRQPNVVTYQGSVEPWSPGWFEYCDARYRSFNPNTGTFRGYDGHDHFCVAK